MAELSTKWMLGILMTMLTIGGTSYFFIATGNVRTCTSGWEFISEGLNEGKYSCAARPNILFYCVSTRDSKTTKNYYCDEAALVEFSKVNITPIIECSVVKTRIERGEQESICLGNQSYIYQDNITKINTTLIRYYNYSCYKEEYVKYHNTTECNEIGVLFEGRKIIYRDNKYSECIADKQLICISELQGDNNGKYDEGEGADFITPSFSITSTKSKNKELVSEVQFEEV